MLCVWQCYLPRNYCNVYCIMYVICSKCENVVLPKVGEQIKGKEEVFCSRCDCKYENRNTTIIKVPISSLTDFAVAMLFV